MTNRTALLFVNDFTDRNKERFYLVDGEAAREATAEEVVNQSREIICHDYWLIAAALYKNTARLPESIMDVEEVRISTSGRREDRENRDSKDVFAALREHELISKEDAGRYRNIIFKNAPFDAGTFSRIGAALLRLADIVEQNAKSKNEWDRYVTLERPVNEYLLRSVSKGLAIDGSALRKHKMDIEHSYYMALKEFSSRYNMPLQVPNDEEVAAYLAPKGFDFSGVGVEYVLKFVPSADGFSEHVRALRKIATSRTVLNAIPMSQARIFPIVDPFGSVTSRIYYKDPSLQNLAKRHRNIIAPDAGKMLSYVDFGQFEAGIMGVLSGDDTMLQLFSSGDLYALAAQQISGDTSKRKPAKRLFLSYAYGMKKKSLIDAAVGFGAERDIAKRFFNSFPRFENWKREVWEAFHANGRIGTSFGNYLTRTETGTISEKEKRSAVSQVVQGTASLIFKKALYRLSKCSDVELKIPMHDAVLFQHAEGFDPQTVAALFADVMTEHFEERIRGKAAVARFFSG